MAQPNVLALQGVPPAMTAESTPFWRATAEGVLRVERCGSCGLHVFPPRGVCRRCHGRDLSWVGVDPPGVLVSYTINHNSWGEGLDGHYGIGLVEFPEYSGVRFVGFLDGFDGDPVIDSLVDFDFYRSVLDVHRVYFQPWLSS